jgi:hypothetical protein
VDLADAPAVGRLDREHEPVGLDPIAGARHAADAVVDEAADGVVLVLVLEVELRVEQLLEVVDRGAPVDDRLVVRDLLDERLLGVVLVLDLADDLLDEVLDRHEAGRATVLVEDDGEVDLPTLELVEQVVDRHRFGHEHRGSQQ